MYEFSIPMPYTIQDIDKLLEVNNKIEKSKITSLYFSLPLTSKLFTGFEQQFRNAIFDKDWDFWETLIEHSFNKGMDFIYLLNSPNSFSAEPVNLEQRLDKLDNLLNELRKIGVNKLRIAEHRLLCYISEEYRDFDIYASTSFELKSIAEYQNFMFMHPKVKQIVPSHDSIKNFQLLKNVNNLFPNVEIELMVNEGCINGCPNRYGHAGDIMKKNTSKKKNKALQEGFFTKEFCNKFEAKNPFISLVKSNVIYPWEILEYSKIGINKFKFVGRDAYQFSFDSRIEHFYLYLKGIDNLKYIENTPISVLIHHLSYIRELKQLSVKEVKKYLPNINHFKKYGHLCSSYCGVTCNYCFKCAEKIQKVFEQKHKEKERIQEIKPVCTMSKRMAGV